MSSWLFIHQNLFECQLGAKVPILVLGAGKNRTDKVPPFMPCIFLWERIINKISSASAKSYEEIKYRVMRQKSDFKLGGVCVFE